MEELKFGKLVDFVHMLVRQYNLDNADSTEALTFIDATCGNGYDTLFLCKHAKNIGNVNVLAFDIQEIAIERTLSLLNENLDYINYEVIKDSHEFINKYLNKSFDIALFNLGYLPQSDKSITTNGSITVNAIDNLLPYLKVNGKIFITTYISHDEGNEFDIVHNYLKDLNKSKYNVLHMNLINKNKTPPELYIIEKNA